MNKLGYFAGGFVLACAVFVVWLFNSEQYDAIQQRDAAQAQRFANEKEKADTCRRLANVIQSPDDHALKAFAYFDCPRNLIQHKLLGWDG